MRRRGFAKRRRGFSKRRRGFKRRGGRPSLRKRIGYRM